MSYLRIHPRSSRPRQIPCLRWAARGSDTAIEMQWLSALLVACTFRRNRLLRSTLGMLLVASIALSRHADANGRPATTNGVYFQPNDPQTILIRSTFGPLLSRDDGCTFRWLCEQNVGYGGTFDPKYAIAADGALFATTFDGLRVSRDGGCSFTTAVAAGTFVDALDIGPSGEVWAGTADSAQGNSLLRSSDNGMTFTPVGTFSPLLSWRSVKVAPSDAQTVYASGSEFMQPSDAGTTFSGQLYVTSDGGQNWTPSPLTGVSFGPTQLITVAAIGPANPMLVYLLSVESAGSGDRLYRSTDAGATFTEVLATTGPINSVVIVDADTVIAAAATSGTFRSDDGGVTFAQILDAPRLGCLGKRSDGLFVGCAANWDPDWMAVGRSPDGMSWEKIFRFVEFAGALECAPGTTGNDTCAEQLWPPLRDQFDVKGPSCGAAGDAGTPAPKSEGCCNTQPEMPEGALVALTVLCILMRPRRRTRR